MKRLTLLLLLIAATVSVFGQDGHIQYKDQGNTKMYGRSVLSRSSKASLDTLTSVHGGTFAYDTVYRTVRVFNGVSFEPLAFGEIKDTCVSVPSASVLTMNASPIVLVPAPGANRFIEFLSGIIHVDFNSVAYNAGTIIFLSAGGGWQGISNDILTASSEVYSSVLRVQGTSGGNLGPNVPLYAQVSTSNPTTGDSDIQICVRYRIIEL